MMYQADVDAKNNVGHTPDRYLSDSRQGPEPDPLLQPTKVVQFFLGSTLFRCCGCGIGVHAVSTVSDKVDSVYLL